MISVNYDFPNLISREQHTLETLNSEELAQWDEYRYARLTDPEAGASIAMEAFQDEIEQRFTEGNLSADHESVLNDLLEYADAVLA